MHPNGVPQCCVLCDPVGVDFFGGLLTGVRGVPLTPGYPLLPLWGKSPSVATKYLRHLKAKGRDIERLILVLYPLKCYETNQVP